MEFLRIWGFVLRVTDSHKQEVLVAANSGLR